MWTAPCGRAQRPSSCGPLQPRQYSMHTALVDARALLQQCTSFHNVHVSTAGAAHAAQHTNQAGNRAAPAAAAAAQESPHAHPGTDAAVGAAGASATEQQASTVQHHAQAGVSGGSNHVPQPQLPQQAQLQQPARQQQHQQQQQQQQQTPAAAAAARAQWLKQLDAAQRLAASRTAQVAPARPALPPQKVQQEPTKQPLLTWRKQRKQTGGGVGGSGAGLDRSSNAEQGTGRHLSSDGMLPGPGHSSQQQQWPPVPWQPSPPVVLQQQQQQQEEEEQEKQGDEEEQGQHLPSFMGQQQQPQQQQQQQMQQQQPQQQQQHQPCSGGGPLSSFMFSPVFTVGRHSATLPLAGSMAQAMEVHQHLLLFATGAAAVHTAVKALATARKFLRASSGGRRELLVQPTLRGRAPGGMDAFAFDVLVAPAPLALDPGVTAPGNRKVRITAGSFEADWARNLATNMPKRGQTVIKVAGAFAVQNAIKAVALARPTMQRQLEQDFVVVPMWCNSDWEEEEAGINSRDETVGNGRRSSSGGGNGTRGGGSNKPAAGSSSGRGVDGAGGSRGGGTEGGTEAEHQAGSYAKGLLPGRQLRPKLRLAVMRCDQNNALCVLPAAR